MGFFCAETGYFIILPLDGSKNQKKQRSHCDLDQSSELRVQIQYIVCFLHVFTLKNSYGSQFSEGTFLEFKTKQKFFLCQDTEQEYFWSVTFIVWCGCPISSELWHWNICWSYVCFCCVTSSSRLVVWRGFFVFFAGMEGTIWKQRWFH